MSTTKTYALLDWMDADAPVYQTTPDKQRVQVKKIPFHRPPMRITFQDEHGRSKTIRFKETSKTIDQSEQIEKEKILANEPFTSTEYDALVFRFGTLETDNEMVQTYLEAHPEYEMFKGKCPTIRRPKYKVIDKVVDSKNKNSDIRLRVRAANKVIDLDLEESQAMLLRLNGSYFKTPTELEECQNLLMEFVDDADEKMLEAIMKEDKEITVDEKTTILIGKLINAGTLSFDAVQGSISKKDKAGKWAVLREISTEFSLDERMRLFSNFLNTADGKPLKNDLENDLKGGYEEQTKRMGRPPKNA